MTEFMTGFDEWWHELEKLTGSLLDATHRCVAEEAWEYKDLDHKATLRSHLNLEKRIEELEGKLTKQRLTLVSAGEKVTGGYLHVKAQHDALKERVARLEEIREAADRMLSPSLGEVEVLNARARAGALLATLRYEEGKDD